MRFLKSLPYILVAILVLSSNAHGQTPESAFLGDGSKFSETGGLVLTKGIFQTEPLAPFRQSGSLVGDRLIALRADLNAVQQRMERENTVLQNIRNTAQAAVKNYQAYIVDLSAHLKTNSASQDMVRDTWSLAKQELLNLESAAGSANRLLHEVAYTQAQASLLAQKTRATYGMSGAKSIDLINLKELEHSVFNTSQISRALLDDLQHDFANASDYLAQQSQRLAAMPVAVQDGDPLPQPRKHLAYMSPAPLLPNREVRRAQEGIPPLVVIRFENNTPDYADQLATAVKRTLDAYPAAHFEIVALAAGQGDPEYLYQSSAVLQRQAQQVVATLVKLGLSPEHFSLYSLTGGALPVNEIQIYIR